MHARLQREAQLKRLWMMHLQLAISHTLAQSFLCIRLLFPQDFVPSRDQRCILDDSSVPGVFRVRVDALDAQVDHGSGEDLVANDEASPVKGEGKSVGLGDDERADDDGRDFRIGEAVFQGPGFGFALCVRGV
jgi:hypothetical protein